MKINKKVLAIFTMAVTSLAMVGNAQAADREFGDIYMECGLGAMIFPTNETMAAISNVTWDLGTTAVSSNVSSPDSCAGSEASAAAFIHDSYPVLEQDLAKGEGEHLSALLNILSCDDSVVATVREDFSKAVSVEAYSETTDFEKAETLYNIMNSSAVSASCSA